MKTHATCTSKLSISRLLVAAILALASPAITAAGMELKTEAFQEVEIKNPDGKLFKKRQALATAVPGAEVIYVITYRNTGTEASDKVVVDNPIPAGLAYVPGSAQGAGTRAEVSVDQGKQFGALTALQVKGANGATRAAKGEDVTHVRWTVLAPVAAAASGSVSYRAVLK